MQYIYTFVKYLSEANLVEQAHIYVNDT